MNVRQALHRDANAIVRLIMESEGMHVSRRGTVRLVDRMLNASRRRKADIRVLVAEEGGQIQGFLSAFRSMRYNSWEDSFVWCVEHVVGRNVLRPLMKALREIAGDLPILVQVRWEDDERAGTLARALRQIGFCEHMETLKQEAVP